MRQGTVLWLFLTLALVSALVAFGLQGPKGDVVGGGSLLFLGLAAVVLVRGYRVPPFPM